MDTEIILRLLRDADIEGDVINFCDSLPEYRQSKEKLDLWFKNAEKALGYPSFCELEAAINQYYSWQSLAYYVFGLHLRDELKRAMMDL